ncbi:MAG: hypothetical protein JWO31_1846 [Phycisphaerales bacterium]|nr:hypothetical protein [Phycisphaerales bacterium]
MRQRAGSPAAGAADDGHSPLPDAPEPRWPALIAGLAAAGLSAALPEYLSVGPWWLPLAVAGPLIVATTLAHRRAYHAANIVLGHVLSAVLTAFLVGSLLLLIRALPEHREAPAALLRSAVALWVVNVLVFALWYWRLDAGGPHARDARPGHSSGAFLFPQMMTDEPGVRDAAAGAGGGPWSPQFIDYLFVAFNTSTAFSPTDTAVLSRWAKVLVMIQASASLAIVAILAARAVNVL